MLPIGIVYAFLAGFTGLIAGWSAYHCTDLVFSIRMLAGLKPLAIATSVPTATSVPHATATLSEAIPRATATLNHAWTPQYLLLDMAPVNKVVRVPVDAVYYHYDDDAALHAATATPLSSAAKPSLVSATPLGTSFVATATNVSVFEEHVTFATLLVVVGTVFTVFVLAIAVASLFGVAQKSRLDFADAQRKGQLAFYKPNETRTSYTDMVLPTGDAMSPATSSAQSQLEVVDIAPGVVSPLALANNRIELDLARRHTHSQAPVALHADLASSDSLTTGNDDAPNAHAHRDSLQSMLEVDRPAALNLTPVDLATQEAPAPTRVKRVIQVTPEERRARRSKWMSTPTNRDRPRLALSSFSKSASAPSSSASPTVPPLTVAATETPDPDRSQSTHISTLDSSPAPAVHAPTSLGSTIAPTTAKLASASSLALAAPAITTGTSGLVVIVEDVAEEPSLEKVADDVVEIKANEDELLVGAQAVTHFTPTAQPAVLSTSLVEPLSQVAQEVSAPDLELKVKPSPRMTPSPLGPTAQSDPSPLFNKRDAYAIADKGAVDEPEDLTTDRLPYEAKGKWRATTLPIEVATGAQVQQQQPQDEDAQALDGEGEHPPFILPTDVSEEELDAQAALLEAARLMPRPSPSRPALFAPGSSKMISSEIMQEIPTSVTEPSVTQTAGIPASPAQEHPQLKDEDVPRLDEHPSQRSPSPQASLLNVYEEDPDVQSVLWRQYSSPAPPSSSELDEADVFEPALTQASGSPVSTTSELSATITDAETPVIEDSTTAQDESTSISPSLGFTPEELAVQSALLAAYRPPTPPPSSPASSEQAASRIAQVMSGNSVESSPAQADSPLESSSQERSAIVDTAEPPVIDTSTQPQQTASPLAQEPTQDQHVYIDDVAPSFTQISDRSTSPQVCPEVDADMDTENVDAQDTVMQNQNESYPAADAGMDLDEWDPSDPGANDYHVPLKGCPDDDDDMALDTRRRLVSPPPMDIDYESLDFARITDPRYQQEVTDALRGLAEQESNADHEATTFDNPYYPTHTPAYAQPAPRSYTPPLASEVFGYVWSKYAHLDQLRISPPPPERPSYMPPYDNGYIPTRPCTPEPEPRAPTSSSSHASTAHGPPPPRRPSTPYDNEYEVDYGTDDDDEDDDAPQPPVSAKLATPVQAAPGREHLTTDEMVKAADILRKLKMRREEVVRRMSMNSTASIDFRTGGNSNSNLDMLANASCTLPPAPTTPTRPPPPPPPPTLVPHPSGKDVRFMNLTQRADWMEMQTDLKGRSYIRQRVFDVEGQGGVAELDDELEERSGAKGTFVTKVSVAGDMTSDAMDAEDTGGPDCAAGGSKKARKRKNQKKNRRQREEAERLAAESERLAQQAAEAEAERLREERRQKVQDAISFVEQEPMRRAEEERREREEARKREEEAKMREELEREKALRTVRPVPKRPAPFTFHAPLPTASSAPTTAVEIERPAGAPIFSYEPTREERQKKLDAEQEKNRRETAATIARLRFGG